jgi:hypothetical protein
VPLSHSTARRFADKQHERNRAAQLVLQLTSARKDGATHIVTLALEFTATEVAEGKSSDREWKRRLKTTSSPAFSLVKRDQDFEAGWVEHGCRIKMLYVTLRVGQAGRAATLSYEHRCLSRSWPMRPEEGTYLAHR